MAFYGIFFGMLAGYGIAVIQRILEKGPRNDHEPRLLPDVTKSHEEHGPDESWGEDPWFGGEP